MDLSTIRRPRSLANDLGPDQECLGGHVICAPKFLEDIAQLFGWKIQEGEVNSQPFSIRRQLTCGQTGSSGSRRSPSQCRTMALDIVQLYITLISEFFKLSDVTLMASQGSNNATPPLIPINSNSFTTAYFLMKILGEVQDSVNELNGMEISGDAASGLRSLLESTRWRFEDILTHAWLRGRLSPIDITLVLMCAMQMRTSSTTSKHG